MIRPVATEIALFVTPFAIYAAFLIIGRKSGRRDCAGYPR